jgi:tRNA pseudouridine13 synthase
LDASQQAKLRAARLPLPSARIPHHEGPLRPLLDRVVAEAGLSLRDLRIKYPRDSFFSKGDRAALFQPGDLRWESDTDDLYAGRQKLTLRFDLPRGSYATILVKRLFRAP